MRNTNHENDPRANDFERAASQGNLKDRYKIYVAFMEGTGEYIKTYSEWLDS